MLVSKRFLSMFIPDIDRFSVEDIFKSLFKSGVEIERYEEIVPPVGLVYGQVEEFSKIEGSDKLHLCKVNIPNLSKTINVVCGASNLCAGMKTVVAIPGSKVMSGKKEIQKGLIFNTLSEGMLCSFSELYETKILKDFMKKIKGIIHLPKDFDLNKTFNLSDLCLDDVIFELTIPINRKDLLTVWGLAQEIKKHLSIEFVEYPKLCTNLEIMECLLYSNGINCEDYLEKSQSEDSKKIIEIVNKKITNEKKIKIIFAYISFVFGFGNKDVPQYIQQQLLNYFFSLDILVSKNVDNELNIFENEIEKTFFYDLNIVSHLTGIDISKIESILFNLNNFGFEFSNNVCKPPKWREDLKSVVDLSEEVLNNIGWDNLPETPISDSVNLVDNNQVLSVENIKEFWRNRGFFECSTFNLGFPTQNKYEGFSIKNPLSKEHSFYRYDVLNKLIRVLDSNKKFKNDLKPIFEVNKQYKRDWILYILVPNLDNSFALNSTNFSYDIYDLRSLIKRSLKYLNIDKNLIFSELNLENLDSIEDSDRSNLSIFDETQTLCIKCGEKNLGYLGYIKKNVVKMTNKNWIAAVVNLSNCSNFDDYNNKKENLNFYSKYPVSIRDISLELLDKDLKIKEIINTIYKNCRTDSNLREVELVEKYVSKSNESEEKTNYLFRLRFQSDKKTLIKEEIDFEVKEICKDLESIGLKIR